MGASRPIAAVVLVDDGGITSQNRHTYKHVGACGAMVGNDVNLAFPAVVVVAGDS